MAEELVSVIITTRNEGNNLKSLLRSLKAQSFLNLEILVVDNNSRDNTKKIAQDFTNLVFNIGPERSAQRNFGAKKAKGKYFLFLDADMILNKDVIRDCVEKIKTDNMGAIIIPEKSFGISFWAKVKAYERSFYLGEDSIEAARFYKKSIFEEVKGFDENLTGPEDWDLSQRVAKIYKISRIKSFINHNEGNLSLRTLMRKKYYYAKSAKVYLKKSKKNTISSQTIAILRPVFYKNPIKIISHPILFSEFKILITASLAS